MTFAKCDLDPPRKHVFLALGLIGLDWYDNHTGVTTNIGQRGQLVIPKAIRQSRRIEPGDDFEVSTDEDDFDLILLRRIRPAANAGLVEHLSACPHKGSLPVPRRGREPMRRPRL